LIIKMKKAVSTPSPMMKEEKSKSMLETPAAAPEEAPAEATADATADAAVAATADTSAAPAA
ncbi:MAG: hypothetical protein ABI478_07965, partial [Propionivibrio sp.]